MASEGVVVIGPQADARLSPPPLSNPEPTADRAKGGAATERSGSHGHMATESSEDTSPRPGEAPKGG